MNKEIDGRETTMVASSCRKSEEDTGGPADFKAFDGAVKDAGAEEKSCQQYPAIGLSPSPRARQRAFIRHRLEDFTVLSLSSHDSSSSSSSTPILSQITLDRMSKAWYSSDDDENDASDGDDVELDFEHTETNTFTDVTRIAKGASDEQQRDDRTCVESYVDFVGDDSTICFAQDYHKNRDAVNHEDPPSELCDENSVESESSLPDEDIYQRMLVSEFDVIENSQRQNSHVNELDSSICWDTVFGQDLRQEPSFIEDSFSIQPLCVKKEKRRRPRKNREMPSMWNEDFDFSCPRFGVDMEERN